MKKLLLLLIIPFLSFGQNKNIGDIYEGGVIFYLTPNNQHGLIVSLNNLGESSWFEAQDIISNPENHTKIGQNYTDWRMPTKFELNQLFLNKNLINDFALKNNYDVFKKTFYWSSTARDPNYGFIQNFKNGKIKKNAELVWENNIRAIRSF